jgi:hypothetical protein
MFGGQKTEKSAEALTGHECLSAIGTYAGAAIVGAPALHLFDRELRANALNRKRIPTVG